MSRQNVPQFGEIMSNFNITNDKISVIGAGSWGTTLANLLAEKGNNVLIWAMEKEVVAEINDRNSNKIFLGDAKLSKNLKATNDLGEAVAGSTIVVFVVPSHASRDVLSKMRNHLAKDAILVSCTKGIEIESGKLMSDIIHESLPNHPASNLTYLSGPSFAKEVIQRLPTTVVIASKNPDAAKKVQGVFRTDRFLTFSSDDVVGIEVGGALKNVMAIATGMSDGLKFGHNTRAALITRGLYEMMKIGKALGGNPLTFTGLAGIGDLVLTCTSELSRNRTVGFEVGSGRKIEDVVSGMKMVAEGVKTTKAVYQLIQRLKITAPICTQMYHILYEGKSPKQAVEDLTRMELHEELRSIM